jgi:hypothetical protein
MVIFKTYYRSTTIAGHDQKKRKEYLFAFFSNNPELSGIFALAFISG